MIAGDGKTIHELEKTAAEDDPDRIAARVQELVLPIRYLNASNQDLSPVGRTAGRKRGQDGRGEAARFDGGAQEYLATARAHASRQGHATPNW